MLLIAMPPAIQSLVCTPSSMCPNSFWMKTLEARKSEMVTENRRKIFAQPFWGELDMNCWSFRQTNRHIAKNGSKHPLNT